MNETLNVNHIEKIEKIYEILERIELEFRINFFDIEYRLKSLEQLLNDSDISQEQAVKKLETIENDIKHRIGF